MESNKFILVVDLDKTLCTKKKDNETYADVKPLELVDIINNIDAEVYIETSRNMLTQNNDESKVVKNVGLTTLEWLNKNNVKYNGIKFGKTYGTCYIDDKALRPKEFIKLYKEHPNDLEDAIKKYLEEN